MPWSPNVPQNTMYLPNVNYRFIRLTVGLLKWVVQEIHELSDMNQQIYKSLPVQQLPKGAWNVFMIYWLKSQNVKKCE